MENNIPSATHQEKAKKMKKLRRWQIAVSLLGVAIIVWGVIEVVCLFLKPDGNQQRCPDRAICIAYQPACFGIY